MIFTRRTVTVREGRCRVLEWSISEVQLIGGIVLHRGRIAEMKTGEGKNFVATLPSYLNALEGKVFTLSQSMITLGET